MAIITSAELADLRATAEEFFDSEAAIYTRVLSRDSFNSEKEDFFEGDIVACRLDFQQTKPAQKDSVEGGAQAPQEVFHLSLPFSAEIAEADRLVVNDNTYAVVSSLDNRSWQAVKRLLVKRVASGDFAAGETSSFPVALDDFGTDATNLFPTALNGFDADDDNAFPTELNVW